MTIIRELVPVAIRAGGEGLGDDEVEIVMSTGFIARDGHILVPEGADLDDYRRNPIFLWQHDPKTPVGTAPEVAVDGNAIRARVKFATLGISHEADKIRGLVKDGVINAVSVGFDPIEGEPIDPKRPRGGQRFSKWKLLECSFVSVPADTGAVVTARELHQESEQMTETTAAAPAPAPKKPVIFRAHRGGIGVAFKRGLYDIGRLAWLLDSLCDAHWSAKIEAALEGDDSAVPGMIAAAMQDLGAALVAMTAEEVSEALAAAIGTDVDDDEDDGAGLDDEATTIILAAAKDGQKRFRIGYYRAHQVATRAGKKHSAETLEQMRAALDEHEEAMRCHREAIAANKRGMACIRSMIDDAAGDEDTGDDDANQEIQTSDGVGESGGSENDRAGVAARRRELEALELVGRAHGHYRETESVATVPV